MRAADSISAGWINPILTSYRYPFSWTHVPFGPVCTVCRVGIDCCLMLLRCRVFCLVCNLDERPTWIKTWSSFNNTVPICFELGINPDFFFADLRFLLVVFMFQPEMRIGFRLQMVYFIVLNRVSLHFRFQSVISLRFNDTIRVACNQRNKHLLMEYIRFLRKARHRS